MQTTNIIERAFELAGASSSVEEVRKALRREGDPTSTPISRAHRSRPTSRSASSARSIQARRHATSRRPRTQEWSRMEPVERAHQLPPEHLQGMQAAPFGTAKIEVERPPVRVRIARMLAEHVELRFPRRAAMFDADGVGQRGVEGVALGDF